MNKPTNLQKLKDKALQDPKVKEEYDKLKEVEEDLKRALREFRAGTEGDIGSYAVRCILRDVLEGIFPSDIKVNTEMLDEGSMLMGVEVLYETK